MRIVPGHTLRIANKLDPSNDLSAYKYARRDPEGNVLLYKTPGSNVFVTIDKQDLGNYTIQVEKPTYHLKGSAFPALITLLMQMKHASELTPEQQDASISEWNEDYQKEVIKDEYGKDLQKDEMSRDVVDARIASVNWNDEQSRKTLSAEEVEYAKKSIDAELQDAKKEKKNLEKNLKNTNNNITRLEEQIAEVQASKVKDEKKLQRLTQQLDKKKLEAVQLENAVHDLDAHINNLTAIQEKVNQEHEKRKQEALTLPVASSEMLEKNE